MIRLAYNLETRRRVIRNSMTGVKRGFSIEDELGLAIDESRIGVEHYQFFRAFQLGEVRAAKTYFTKAVTRDCVSR